ncbi:DUF4446 family protein [Eubacterium xylanophilum]|uniref:DUF4446 family protein n=1 Tax=Eubacterium xylanophilum TaxID=39497 RepID=UPI00047AB459|nr:DUF4446 family protein [Eubacterium xylanophilum]
MFHWTDVGIDADLVSLILIGLVVLLFVLVIVALAKISSLRLRYETFMEGKDGKSLEEAFQDKFDNMEEINDEIVDINKRLVNIDKNLLKTYQKLAIVKYDAFKEVGGTISFVLAMLNNENDGFIFNSMHSNAEGCYSFIKEVKGGEVFVTLSEEEKQALEQALNCK